MYAEYLTKQGFSYPAIRKHGIGTNFRQYWENSPNKPSSLFNSLAGSLLDGRLIDKMGPSLGKIFTAIGGNPVKQRVDYNSALNAAKHFG